MMNLRYVLVFLLVGASKWLSVFICLIYLIGAFNTIMFSPQISCEESSFSDYSDKECVPDTDGSSSDNSCESKELNICHAEPVEGGAVEFKSTTDTSTSSSYHSSTSVTSMPTKVQKNRYKKIQYCVYCQKPYSKIALHLEFVHRNELEVAKAFSFDKRSKERRVRLCLLKSSQSVSQSYLFIKHI